MSDQSSTLISSGQLVSSRLHSITSKQLYIDTKGKGDVQSLTNRLELTPNDLVDALGEVFDVVLVQPGHADPAVGGEVDVSLFKQFLALLGFGRAGERQPEERRAGAGDDSRFSPVKENMPIWSTMWFHPLGPTAGVLYLLVSSSNSFLRISMMRSAIPLMSDFHSANNFGSLRMRETYREAGGGGQ